MPRLARRIREGIEDAPSLGSPSHRRSKATIASPLSTAWTSRVSVMDDSPRRGRHTFSQISTLAGASKIEVRSSSPAARKRG
jgi:hypothetical protein